MLSPPLVTSGTAPRRIAMVLAFAVALACTPEQTVAPSPTPSPEPSPPPFMSLVDAGTRATYKATYRMTGSAQGQPVRGSWAIYSKPPRLRGDISVTAGGRTEAYSTYLLSDGAVICQLGGTPRCQTVSRDALEQQAPAQQIDALLRRNPDDFEVAYEGSRRVVGLLGFCYEVRPKPAVQVGFTESHFCYAADGVMLLGLVRSAQGEVDFEATEVSRAVADSDLEPPAR